MDMNKWMGEGSFSIGGRDLFYTRHDIFQKKEKKKKKEKSTITGKKIVGKKKLKEFFIFQQIFLNG